VLGHLPTLFSFFLPFFLPPRVAGGTAFKNQRKCPVLSALFHLFFFFSLARGEISPAYPFPFRAPKTQRTTAHFGPFNSHRFCTMRPSSFPLDSFLCFFLFRTIWRAVLFLFRFLQNKTPKKFFSVSFSSFKLGFLCGRRAFSAPKPWSCSSPPPPLWRHFSSCSRLNKSFRFSQAKPQFAPIPITLNLTKNTLFLLTISVFSPTTLSVSCVPGVRTLNCVWTQANQKVGGAQAEQYSPFR